MILEIFLIITLIMVLYKLQTLSNQNNQVIEMVSSINSRMITLEGRIVSGKPNENSKPLEQSISDVLKNLKIELPIDSKQSTAEELITPPPPPSLNLSNNNSNISKKGLILNAADYLRGAYVQDLLIIFQACLDFYCENWKPLVSNCEYSSQSIGTEQFCNISSHLNVPIIKKVQFRFKENYGDSEMTCVGLVRVYGEPKTPEHIEERNKLWREDICNRYIWYYHNMFVKNTLMNKRCSVLYKYECCSDCPECCEQCVISDYTEHVIMAPIITIVFFFVAFLCCCYCAYRDAQRQNARQFS
ncbi:hypothetical protein B9Z55_000333 [Caenorhabditis nigoni]|nr:hypothetical protein B9Z55_000333 [Caenorhabditis nigoni]